MIVLDASFLYALLDRRDRRHGEAAGWYEGLDDELITTPLVLAEVDHLAATRAGAAARGAFHADVAAGAYAVDWWAAAGRDSVAVASRYEGLGLSLTDASLVALAGRTATNRVATFDERHFRAVAPLTRHEAFALLPADAV